MAASTSASTSVRSPPRAVTFSEYSELFVFMSRSDRNDLSKAWYSSKDSYRFRRVLVEEVRRISHEIHDLPLGDVMSHEQMCFCLGAEKYMSGVGAAEYSDRARRANIAAVLSEQHRQKQMGICDIESLSNVSMRGSEWSTTRARKLAMGYAICDELKR